MSEQEWEDKLEEIQKHSEHWYNKYKELKEENERIKTKYYELQETLKKVRLALIKERTANIMTYNKGGVEIFDDMFEILKGVSN